MRIAATAAGISTDGPINLDDVTRSPIARRSAKLLNHGAPDGDSREPSDLHFEPFETSSRFGSRPIGVLYEMVPPPRTWRLRSHPHQR